MVYTENSTFNGATLELVINHFLFCGISPTEMEYSSRGDAVYLQYTLQGLGVSTYFLSTVCTAQVVPKSAMVTNSTVNSMTIQDKCPCKVSFTVGCILVSHAALKYLSVMP